MCFSPVASFVGGSILFTLGICTIFMLTTLPSNVTLFQRLTYLPLACVPLIFGAQQISEGFVWLDTTNRDAICSFTFFAYGFWPFWMPFSFMLAETNHFKSGKYITNGWKKILLKTWVSSKKRFRWLLVNTLIGLAFLIYTALTTSKHSTSASIRGHHIVYGAGSGATYSKKPSIWNTEDALVVAVYIYIIISTMFLTSVRGGTILAMVSITTLVIAIIVAQVAWTSVWCFFESIVSAILMGMIWADLHN